MIMEQDELIVDENYLKGFNRGYVLTENVPDMVNTILKVALPENDYFSGFKDGKQEFEMEKARERLKGLVQNDAPNRDISKDKGKSK